MLQATVTNIHPSAVSTLLKEEITFNLWANKKLANWIQEKIAAEPKKEKVALQTLRVSLVRIIRAEKYWYDRLRSTITPVTITAYDELSLEDILHLLRDTSSLLMHHIKALSDYGFYEELTVHHHCPEPTRLPAYEIIQHALLYSASQRGQLINLAHSLSWGDTPGVDYLSFLLVMEMDSAGNN